VAVVRLDEGNSKRVFVLLRWGLVPFWAEQPNTGYSLINARAEVFSIPLVDRLHHRYTRRATFAELNSG
jgi:hypothetical protein